MTRIFLGNFDFEHELAGTAAGIQASDRDAPALFPRAPGGAHGAELFWAWLPLAEAKDFVIAPGRIDLRDFDGLQGLELTPPHFIDDPRGLTALRDIDVVPWGWTDSVVRWGKSRGWRCAAPPLEVVWQVNNRAFRFGLEQDLNVALPGTALVTSLPELERVIQRHATAPRGWLLKANFGMSGREAVRGRGSSLEGKTRNWAQKRLAAGPIVFEPIVERIAEAGIQIEVSPTGPPRLVGVTPLLVDRSGVYRGSRFGCPVNEIEPWRPAVEVGMRVAHQVQQLGYFGPLGTDAMLYRGENREVRLRPLQDLNARYTMGRLALGFRRLLPAGGCGTWLHFHRRHLAGRDLEEWLNAIREKLPANVLAVATSPRTIASQPVEHHGVVLAAPSSEVRRQAEAVLLDGLGIDVDGCDHA